MLYPHHQKHLSGFLRYFTNLFYIISFYNNIRIQEYQPLSFCTVCTIITGKTRLCIFLFEIPDRQHFPEHINRRLQFYFGSIIYNNYFEIFTCLMRQAIKKLKSSSFRLNIATTMDIFIFYLVYILSYQLQTLSRRYIAKHLKNILMLLLFCGFFGSFIHFILEEAALQFSVEQFYFSDGRRPIFSQLPGLLKSSMLKC